MGVKRNTFIDYVASDADAVTHNNRVGSGDALSMLVTRVSDDGTVDGLAFLPDGAIHPVSGYKPEDAPEDAPADKPEPQSDIPVIAQPNISDNSGEIQ